MRHPAARLIQNIIELNRFGSHLSAEAKAQLAALGDEFAAIFARHDPTAVLTRYQRARIQKILDAFNVATDSAYAALVKETRANLAGLGAQQAGWAADQLRSGIAQGVGQVSVRISAQGLGQNFFKSILSSQPIHGKLLESWFSEASDRTKQNVAQQVRLGMAQNETSDQIIRRIRGKSDGRGGFRGGVMQTSTKNAEAIVRTASNDIANTAHLKTYQQNADVVTEVEFIATLDDRTTPICIATDGKRWPLDSEEIARPPLHVKCRSSIIPRINWDGLGLVPPDEGTRASATGQVPAGMTYDNWLRTQSPKVQDKVLGPGKAQLWRDGKIKNLRELIKRDRSVRTLAELEALAG